jgi:acyl carrier protein
MTRQEILDSLKEVLTLIRPSLDLSAVNEDSQLTSDLGLDSLTTLLLSLAIENKFNFKFEGMVKFNTVGEVIDHIIEKTK